MIERASSSIYKGFIYWFTGITIFLGIELIFNFKAGRLFFSWGEPITIFLIYILASLSAGALFGYLKYFFERKLPHKHIDADIWFWLSFFAFWLYIYILLWVNDKNPYTFFAPISLAANFGLLLIFTIPSLGIYKACLFLKRKGFKDLFLLFCAFCVSYGVYIICGLELNWQRYRLSVEMVEKFLNMGLVFFNLYLLLGCILLFILVFYLLVLSKNFLGRHTINKRRLFLGNILIVIFLSILVFRLSGLKANRKISHSANLPNIILIVMDAVRSRELSCYGYPKPTSPNLDKFTREAFVFDNCISNFTHTKTAVPALLSSQYTTLLRLKNKKFMNNRKFLQEYLSGMRYFNLLFLGANFSPEIVAGMNRGFDYCPTQWGSFYDYFLTRAGITLYKVKITHKYPASSWVADAEKLVDKFASWLTKNKGVAFFAFFDFQNTHSPYPVPATYKRAFFKGTADEAYSLGKEWEIKKDKIDKEKLNDIVALYDDAIRYEDQSLARLFEMLKSFGLLDKTLVIISADHGDSFLDHGTTHHAHSVYDEIVKVPLVIRFPGRGVMPERIEEQVALIDVMPTILDFLGTDISKENFEGESFLSLCSVKGADSGSFKRKYVISLKEANFIGIRTLKWKLVFADESKKELFGTREIGHKAARELFDLEEDPLELENVYDRHKEESDIRGLEETLLKYKRRVYDTNG